MQELYMICTLELDRKCMKFVHDKDLPTERLREIWVMNFMMVQAFLQSVYTAGSPELKILD